MIVCSNEETSDRSAQTRTCIGVGWVPPVVLVVIVIIVAVAAVRIDGDKECSESQPDGCEEGDVAEPRPADRLARDVGQDHQHLETQRTGFMCGVCVGGGKTLARATGALWKC